MANNSFRSCAILGATGLVGQELLSIMNKDNKFTFEKLLLFSSSQTKNISIQYKGKKITVLPFDENKIPDVDVLFSSVDETLSKKFVPLFLKKGTYVIDDSSAFRLDRESALVLDGINDNLIKKSQKLYSQPNCALIGIAYPLHSLIPIYHIKKIYVSTYQSISGAGRNAMADFSVNLKNYIEGKNIKLNVFKNNPVLNAIPVIPDYDFHGKTNPDFTKEEEKIALETNKILGKQNNPLPILATCVRVSVTVGHSACVFIEVKEQPDFTKISKAFQSNKHIEFSNNMVFTPQYAAGKDKVFVCRLRLSANTICFWTTWDNLRIGSGLNMWNIFKKLLAQLPNP